MCEPTTLLIASTAFQAISTISQANDQAAAVKQQAANTQAVNEYNAKQQDFAAQDARQRGANDAATIRENARKTNAELRARAGSSGFLAEGGSYGDIQDQNAQVGAFDSLQIMNNAEREAYGFESEATGLRWQGELAVKDAKRQASSIKRNGLLSAAGTLVTGAANYSSKFANPLQRTTTLSNGETIRWNTDRSGRRY